jgi:hypothetical protein
MKWFRQLGLLDEGAAPFTSLVAPDAVIRGKPFQITVSTFGSASTTRADGHDVSASQGALEVRLYDQSAPSLTRVTRDYLGFPRTLTVQFDQPGTAVIRVVGRGAGLNGQSPRTITKTIKVQ